MWVSHSSLVFWVQNEAKGAVEFMGLEKGKMAVFGSLGGRAALTVFLMAAQFNFVLNFLLSNGFFSIFFVTVNEARLLHYFLPILHSIECKEREIKSESRLFERCTWPRKCSGSQRPAAWQGRREKHTGHSDAQEHVPCQFELN